MTLDNEDLIYRLACECEGLFDQLREALATIRPDVAIAELCAEFQQRFAIWAAHLGVFARKSQCLDTRLRNLADIQDLVVRLLDILRRSLQQCKVEATSQRERDPVPAGVDESRPEASRIQAASMGAIDDTLTRLNRLGVTIRQSSSGKIDTRANKFAAGLNLKPFADLCANTVQALYPSAHQSLKDYLSKSMTDRYARMQFLNSRHKKLEIRREPSMGLPPIVEVSNNKTQTNVSIAQSARVIQTPVTTNPNLLRPPTAPSQSDLSTVNIQQIRSRLRPPDEASTKLHKTSSIQVKQGNYPQPPVTNGNSSYFTCEWCFELVSRETLSESGWRRHIDRDLKPYVCLSEECPEAHPVYPTFDEWFKHMGLHNRRWHQEVYSTSSWVCVVCEFNPDAYINSQSLYSHLKESHHGDFTTAQLQTISQQSKAEQPRAWNDCLLCCFAVEEQRNKGEAVFPKRRKGQPKQDTAKSARKALEMTNPDPHSSDSEFSDTSSDLDDVGSHQQRPQQTKNGSRAISRHIAMHLQLLMSLTLRFAALQNGDGSLDDDIKSDSVDIDEGNGSSEGNDLGKLSDIASEADMKMNDVDEADNAKDTMDLDDGVVEDDIPVPDTDFDLEDIPRQHDDLSAENDAFLKKVIESGAYRSWQDEHEATAPLSLWSCVYDTLRNQDPQMRELLEAKDKHDGQTPLSWAAGGGYEHVVNLLLEKGADLEAKDENDGRTPLSTASNNGHEVVVKLLLDRGADVTVTDNDGWTPLNLASNNGHEAVVKLLLEKGADVTVANNEGWSPLRSASNHGHEAVVKLLLEKGGNVTVASNYGWLKSRTSNVFHDQSHFDSTSIDSDRDCDDHMPEMETLQSMDTTSMETADQYFSSRTPADSYKEPHRLVQRRNVIKDFIDTEAVFVRDMNIVEEVYKGTAEACPKLDDKTIKLIFRNSDEIVEFHTSFLSQLQEAVASAYVPDQDRTPMRREDSRIMSESRQSRSVDPGDANDRATSLGSAFQANIEKMKLIYEGFLRNSDQAAKCLVQIQQDETVKTWLNECNEVARDLTAVWDLGSLLIKPMQRIIKYPEFIITLLQHTPLDHPDRDTLVAAKDALTTAIVEIDKTKKNFELVSQIVNRKRKESEVKVGFTRAFGKRVNSLQASNSQAPEDAEYAKLNEKFGDDYLRLQVAVRDVELYTRQVSAYVQEFLQYISSIELVMRLQPGSYPELETKWVQFSISVRDLEKVSLEVHLAQVRKHMIEPFEQVIIKYGNPSLAMKKRQKRRLDYERSEQLKRGGKKVDRKLRELVEEYEALNDMLKKELPILESLTNRVANICLGNFVNIQANWYRDWSAVMKTVLGDCSEMPDLDEVVSTFQRDFRYEQERLNNIGILNAAPSILDAAPSLPTPDFGMRRSGSLTMPSDTGGTELGSGGRIPSPHHYYYRDYYSGIQAQQGDSASPRSPEIAGSSRSAGVPTQSLESAKVPRPDSPRPDSSSYQPYEGKRFSRSALPLLDRTEASQRSSSASLDEGTQASEGYNVLWLAASLFEMNISATKHEAGYPYLTYQAGEIFNVIAEKGELWLAENQDETGQFGWIWSKHFAKLADA